MKPPGLEITISFGGGSWRGRAQLKAAILKAVTAAADAAGLDAGARVAVSFRLTGDAEIRALNQLWRGKDQPTNVLSFPAAARARGRTGPSLIGDVVLACETVTVEAREQQKALGDHVTHLAVHGFLHLLGYDHINRKDAAAMETLEIRILERLGVASPYTV